MSSQRIQRKKRGREIERERDRDRIKDRERERERDRERQRDFSSRKGDRGTENERFNYHEICQV